MAVFTGWYALGTGVSSVGVFQEATTYTRPAVSLAGSAAAGLTQNVSQITGPTGPVGGILYKGAIFDALTGGNCLCYWDWTLLTAVPANFAAITVNVQLNDYLKAALSLSSTGGQGSSGSTVDAGAQIGTLNGQPLIAATKLGIQAGNLVAQSGAVIQVPGTGLLFQGTNGTNVGSIDANGNLSLTGATTALTTTGKLTINGGGNDLLINVGGVAVASIGTAGNLILKGTVTASGTPA